MDYISGPYHIDVNVEKTQAFYAKACGILCDCAGCRNFSQAIPYLPEDVKAFFAQFGVDPANPEEISVLHSSDGVKTLYSGFYHVCGTILSDKTPWIRVAEKQHLFNEEYAIDLSNEFRFFFEEECFLVDEDFPTPVFQMEFCGNLPWVIDTPNPYT